MSTIAIRALGDYSSPTGTYTGDYFAIASVAENPGDPSLNTRKSTVADTMGAYAVQSANYLTGSSAYTVEYDANSNIEKDTILTVGNFGNYISPVGGIFWQNPCQGEDGSYDASCGGTPMLSAAPATAADLVLIIPISSGGSDADITRTFLKNQEMTDYGSGGTEGPTGTEMQEDFLTVKAAYEWCFNNADRGSSIHFLIDSDIEWNASGTSPRPGGDPEMRGFRYLKFWGKYNGGPTGTSTNNTWRPGTFKIDVNSTALLAGRYTALWFRNPIVDMTDLEFDFRIGAGVRLQKVMTMSSAVHTLARISITITSVSTGTLHTAGRVIVAGESGIIYHSGDCRYDLGALNIDGGYPGTYRPWYTDDASSQIGLCTNSLANIHFVEPDGSDWGIRCTWYRLGEGNLAASGEVTRAGGGSGTGTPDLSTVIATIVDASDICSIDSTDFEVLYT
jgi:hypothetical protein